MSPILCSLHMFLSILTNMINQCPRPQGKLQGRLHHQRRVAARDPQERLRPRGGLGQGAEAGGRQLGQGGGERAGQGLHLQDDGGRLRRVQLGAAGDGRQVPGPHEQQLPGEQQPAQDRHGAGVRRAACRADCCQGEDLGCRLWILRKPGW